MFDACQCAPATFGQVLFGKGETVSFRFQAGDVQDVVDEVKQEGRIVHDDMCVLFPFVPFFHLGIQNLGESDDRVQRSTDLVAHIREEQAFQPVRFFRMVAGDT